MRPALWALPLTVLLVTTGCLGVLGPSRPPSDQRALEAVARSQAAAEDVETYRFTLDGRIRADDGDERVTIDVAGDGVVDVARRRMNVTVRARGDARTTYVAGTTAYTECSRFGWGRENLTRSTRWLDYTPLGQQLALLDRTDVYWRGTRSLNGAEAAVVVAYPTKRELESVTDVRGTDATGLEGANVRNVTVTTWISTETGRVLKVRREARLRRDGARARATVTFRFAGYDEPANVTRPAFDEDDVWELGCPGS